MTYKEYVDGEITYEEYIADKMFTLTEGKYGVRVMCLTAHHGLVRSGFGDPINGSPIPVGSVVRLPSGVAWDKASMVVKPSDLHVLVDHHDSE